MSDIMLSYKIVVSVQYAFIIIEDKNDCFTYETTGTEIGL